MFFTLKLCTHAKLNFWNRTSYLHWKDLALDNLQRLICHKTQPTNQHLENKGRTLKWRSSLDSYAQTCRPAWAVNSLMPTSMSYLHQLCANVECSLEELAVDDGNRLTEGVKKTRPIRWLDSVDDICQIIHRKTMRQNLTEFNRFLLLDQLLY